MSRCKIVGSKYSSEWLTEFLNGKRKSFAGLENVKSICRVNRILFTITKWFTIISMWIVAARIGFTRYMDCSVAVIYLIVAFAASTYLHFFEITDGYQKQRLIIYTYRIFKLKEQQINIFINMTKNLEAIKRDTAERLDAGQENAVIEDIKKRLSEEDRNDPVFENLNTLEIHFDSMDDKIKEYIADFDEFEKDARDEGLIGEN